MNAGSGRGRLTAAAKARLVGEALKPGVDVASLARRHGVGASSLYAWCRSARQAASGDTENRLVPVVIDDAVASLSGTAAGEIEITLPSAVRVVVRGAVAAEDLRAVLAVLRG